MIPYQSHTSHDLVPNGLKYQEIIKRFGTTRQKAISSWTVNRGNSFGKQILHQRLSTQSNEPYPLCLIVVNKEHFRFLETRFLECWGIWIILGRLAWKNSAWKVGHDLEIIWSRLVHKQVVIQNLEKQECKRDCYKATLWHYHVHENVVYTCCGLEPCVHGHACVLVLFMYA